MKTLLSALAALCWTVATAQSNLFPSEGRVGIGTLTPDTSAIFDIKSPRQGVLIPRMKKVQRDAIHVPATGLLIFQTNSSGGFYYYTGTSWTQLTNAGANTSLSNLQSTAVNVNLEPSIDNSTVLGDSLKKWDTLYIKLINLDGDTFVSDGTNKGDANTYIGASHNTATTGTHNVWVGNDAGKANTSGHDNSFVGLAAGRANTIGSRNCFFGMNAGRAITLGLKNTFFGFNAGKVNNIGLSNTFIGYKSAFKNTSGEYNSLYGYLSGNTNATGSQNVYFGSNTGINATGTNNTFVGYRSGVQVTTGTNCTFIGSNTDATLVSAANSIAIGNSATIDQSNIIRFGNTDVSKIGIGCTPLANDILDFQATTAKLTTGGTWTNASDRKLKNNFQDLNANDILNGVNQLHIQRWHYIDDRDATSHIGPVAQDFYQLFEVGDETTISTIDPSGVALLSIQSLTERGQEKDAIIAQQEAQLTELGNMIANLQQSISQRCTGDQH